MPSAIDALVSIWSALPALSGALVTDGPPLSQQATQTIVRVGDDADPDANETSSFSRTWRDLACTRQEETGVIVCSVEAWSGSTELETQRDAAFTLLAALSTSLIADMTLGGAVDTAMLALGSQRPFQNSAGSAVIVPFSVSYRATI
jgi:hypothetical protein